MISDDMKKYCDRGLAIGFTHVQPILPSSVVTAPWVRLKCQFGCVGYGLSHCCPPNTPTHEETRQVLDSYEHALLFHPFCIRMYPFSPSTKRLFRCRSIIFCTLRPEFLYLNVFHYFIMFIVCSENGVSIGYCRRSY